MNKMTENSENITDYYEIFLASRMQVIWTYLYLPEGIAT